MKFWFFFLLFYFVDAFHEKIYFPHSIDRLFTDDRIWKKLERKKNFEKIQDGEYDIKVSYHEWMMGYHYESQYNIQKTNNIVEIVYQNKFLQNNITIVPVQNDFLQISVSTKTFTPIPSRIMNQIIRSKIYHLFDL